MDCKQKMLAALEEHMDALTEELEGMSRDADCREGKRHHEAVYRQIKRHDVSMRAVSYVTAF